jgi:hypothetical protein
MSVEHKAQVVGRPGCLGHTVVQRRLNPCLPVALVPNIAAVEMRYEVNNLKAPSWTLSIGCMKDRTRKLPSIQRLS